MWRINRFIKQQGVPAQTVLRKVHKVPSLLTWTPGLWPSPVRNLSFKHLHDSSMALVQCSENFLIKVTNSLLLALKTKTTKKQQQQQQNRDQSSKQFLEGQPANLKHSMRTAHDLFLHNPLHLFYVHFTHFYCIYKKACQLLKKKGGGGLTMLLNILKCIRQLPVSKMYSIFMLSPAICIGLVCNGVSVVSD